MSLTSLLKTRSPLRIFFAETFHHTSELVAKLNDDLAEVGTIGRADLSPSEAALVGMALDYRVRLYFAPFDLESTVAWHGLAGVMASLTKKQRAFCEHFAGELSYKLANALLVVKRRLPRTDEDWLNAWCLVLAHLEQFYRGAFAPERSPLYQALTTCSTVSAVRRQVGRQRLLEDLRTLSWSFHRRWKTRLRAPVVLNPTFAGSEDVGGADADIIVGGILLDIKTSKQPRPVRLEHLWQLMGYVLLDYPDKYGINAMGFEFPRHQLTRYWPVQELITVMADSPQPVTALRRRFRRVCVSLTSAANWSDQ